MGASRLASLSLLAVLACAVPTRPPAHQSAVQDAVADPLVSELLDTLGARAQDPAFTTARRAADHGDPEPLRRWLTTPANPVNGRPDPDAPVYRAALLQVLDAAVPSTRPTGG